MKPFQIIIILLGAVLQLPAQDVSFGFANPGIVEESGVFYYEVDVTIRSNAGFALGSGQLYINYNTSAFGPHVKRNNHLSIRVPSGYVLAASAGVLDFYRNKVQNDNTSDRFSFSWQQGDAGSGCLGGNNVSSSSRRLFRIRLKFLDGAVGQSPGLCFESGGLYDDQTFTACGPTGSCTNKDCTNHADEQITNDKFSCSGAVVLPVEFLGFQAWVTKDEQVALNWQTATELNNDYFAVERSADGLAFQELFRVKGAGSTTEIQTYLAFDEVPLTGDNYYRLRQVDFDGTFIYSELRVVRFTTTRGMEVQVYPNPVSNLLHVNFGEQLPAQSQIRLLDVAGRVVRTYQLVEATDFQQLDVRLLPRGTYLLHVSGTKNLWTREILVQ